MEREKGLAKGKILSKKRIKVLFVLNIILSIIMAILLLKIYIIKITLILRHF